MSWAHPLSSNRNSTWPPHLASTFYISTHWNVEIYQSKVHFGGSMTTQVLGGMERWIKSDDNFVLATKLVKEKKTTSHSLLWVSFTFSKHSGLKKKIMCCEDNFLLMRDCLMRDFFDERHFDCGPAEGEFAESTETAEVCWQETSQAQWLCSLKIFCHKLL